MVIARPVMRVHALLHAGFIYAFASHSRRPMHEIGTEGAGAGLRITTRTISVASFYQWLNDY